MGSKDCNKWGKVHGPDNTGSSADDVPMYPQDGLQGMQYTCICTSLTYCGKNLECLG
jgi:hypothetical protein